MEKLLFLMLTLTSYSYAINAIPEIIEKLKIKS